MKNIEDHIDLDKVDSHMEKTATLKVSDLLKKLKDLDEAGIDPESLGDAGNLPRE